MSALLESMVAEQAKKEAELGAEKLAAKNYPEAIRHYKAAIAQGNADQGLYNNLAWSLYLNGNCKEALEQVNQSISIKPTSYNNHTKAAILKCQDRCAEALQFYDEAIRLCLKEKDKITAPEYYTDRAEAKKCLGIYADAIEDLEMALAIKPGDAQLKKALEELKRLNDSNK